MRDASEAKQEAWIRAMFYPTRLSAQQVSSFRLGDIGSRPRIPLDLAIFYLEIALDGPYDIAFFAEDDSTETAHLIRVLRHRPPKHRNYEPGVKLVALLSTIDGANYRNILLPNETRRRLQDIIRRLTPTEGKSPNSVVDAPPASPSAADLPHAIPGSSTYRDAPRGAVPCDSWVLAPPSEELVQPLDRPAHVQPSLGPSLAGLPQPLVATAAASHPVPAARQEPVCPEPSAVPAQPWTPPPHRAPNRELLGFHLYSEPTAKRCDPRSKAVPTSVPGEGWTLIHRNRRSSGGSTPIQTALPKAAGIALENSFAALTSLSSDPEPDFQSTVQRVRSPSSATPSHGYERVSKRGNAPRSHPTLADFLSGVPSPAVEAPSSTRRRRRPRASPRHRSPLPVIAESNGETDKERCTQSSCSYAHPCDIAVNIPLGTADREGSPSPTLPPDTSSDDVAATASLDLPSQEISASLSVIGSEDGHLSSFQEGPEELGLAGVVSARLPPEASEGFPEDSTDDDDDGLPPFYLTVRWQGKFHSVQIRESRIRAIRHLPEALLAALNPAAAQLLDPLSRPIVSYYGGAVGGEPAQILRKLRYNEIPHTWHTLRLFSQRAGFVTLNLPLRGGSDRDSSSQSSQSSQVSVSAQLPSTDDVSSWASLDATFNQLMRGGDLQGLHFVETAQLLMAFVIPSEFAILDQVDLTAQRLVTPARVAALQTMLHSIDIPPVQLPDWIQPDRGLAVRLNGLTVQDLLPSTSANYRPHVQDLTRALTSMLESASPEIAALRLSRQEPQAYTDMVASLQITFGNSVSHQTAGGNTSSRQALDAQVILPPGDGWRQTLMTRHLGRSGAGYLSLFPNLALVEAPLHPADSTLLKALDVATSGDGHSFRNLVSHAFSRVLGGSYAQLRYSTDDPDSRDRRHLVPHGPRSSKSQLVLGTGLLALLEARRISRVVELLLGSGDMIPVRVTVSLPEVPVAALWTLIKQASPGALVPLEAVDPQWIQRNPPLPLVVGPLSRNWTHTTLHEPGRVELGAKLQNLSESLTFRSSQNDQACLCRFVGKPLSPHAVMFECPDPTALQFLVAHLSSSHGMAQLETSLGSRGLRLFLAAVPLECLNLLAPRDFQKSIAQYAAPRSK